MSIKFCSLLDVMEHLRFARNRCSLSVRVHTCACCGNVIACVRQQVTVALRSLGVGDTAGIRANWLCARDPQIVRSASGCQMFSCHVAGVAFIFVHHILHPPPPPSRRNYRRKKTVSEIWAVHIDLCIEWHQFCEAWGSSRLQSSGWRQRFCPKSWYFV